MPARMRMKRFMLSPFRETLIKFSLSAMKAACILVMLAASRDGWRITEVDSRNGDG
jgi:hypothetical protein